MAALCWSLLRKQKQSGLEAIGTLRKGTEKIAGKKMATAVAQSLIFARKAMSLQPKKKAEE